ncbi:sigma-70 family RNA polymerase sigma factor [Nocardioides conyzicola]|uniref:Sigma-70 family RNA polymerase sigma factor n=1 Tax=Nocardioides conyzicola TaxID=1651781 RepID=A0ABP8WU40_9ACTN
MGPSVSTLDERSDAELISAVRAGDVASYGELFARHVDAARRLGRQLVPGPDVDDLVSEAFTKVLGVLQRGGGPDLAFRAYLLTAVRRLHVDRIRSTARLHTTDDLTPFDPGVPFRDTAVEGFESAAAARAFASLPERWQLVLWHTEVEEQKPAEVAPLLGMTPNAVSALAYRAREGLRQAYLSMHAADNEDDTCERTRAELGAYVRGGLSRRDAARVEQHLQECRACTALYLELTEVNSNLRAVLAPLLLGSAAAAYVASTGSVSATGLALLLGRARDAVLAHGPTAAVAGVAAAAVVAASVMTFNQDRDGSPSAEDTPALSGPAGAGTPSVAPGRDRPLHRDRRGAGPAAEDAPAATPRTGASAPAPSSEPSTRPSAGPTGGGHPTTPPTAEPSRPPTEQPSTPPLVDLSADVSVGPDGVAVGLGLGLGGVPVVPHTTVGVPLPPLG